MTATGLVLDRVTIALPGHRPLIGELSLEVAPGGIATLIGPSGSGKSSLLAWITGTLDPAFNARGRVFVAGRDVTQLPPERRRIAILFQDDLLFPHLTVAGNLAFALPRSPTGADGRAARIAAALAEAQLAGFEDRDPATLSGGQRARVSVLRALLAEPQALLLDEPFARLDAALRGRFRAFVFEHVRRRALPTLMVSHDRADADLAGGPVVTIGQDAGAAPDSEAGGEPTVITIAFDDRIER
jgi:putative thiamine transport system ATP-binding protein